MVTRSVKKVQARSLKAKSLLCRHAGHDPGRDFYHDSVVHVPCGCHVLVFDLKR